MMEAQEPPTVQGVSFPPQRLPILRAHIRMLIRRLSEAPKTRD